MVKSVKWNKRVLDTFYETAEYLEENFSQKAANNFVNSILDKIEVIKKYPDIGRKTPKRRTIRFVLVGKHRRLSIELKVADLSSQAFSILDNILIKTFINKITNCYIIYDNLHQLATRNSLQPDPPCNSASISISRAFSRLRRMSHASRCLPTSSGYVTGLK